MEGGRIVLAVFWICIYICMMWREQADTWASHGDSIHVNRSQIDGEIGNFKDCGTFERLRVMILEFKFGVAVLFLHILAG